MSNANQQLQALFQGFLNANSFPSHIKVTASLHKKTAQLVLEGEVPIEFGSLLNLCTYDFIKQHGSTTDWTLDYERIHRGPLKFVKRAKTSEAPSSVKVERPLSVPDDELTEFSETEQSLHRKIAFVAEWIQKFRGTPSHPIASAPETNGFVIYTGAGISTAAKIPDFRGPQGVWTRRDRGLAPPKSITMEQAIPTLAHRAVKRLLDDKIATYLVSQNVDGLHRRSGVPADLISELHGNCYIETCASCQAEYLRTFDVCNHRGPYFSNVQDKVSASGISHITGRKCTACGGMLRDSIIHFRENLPEEALSRGIDHSKRAKMGLVLGSSLHVTPAADLPVIVSEHNSGVLCVVNLQATGRDVEALWSGGILIHAKLDQFVDLLMKHLGYLPNAYAEESKEEQQLAAGVADLGVDEAADDVPKGPPRNSFFNKIGLPSSMVQLPPSLTVSQTIHSAPGVWSLDLILPKGYPSALGDIVHSVTYCGVSASTSAPVTPEFKAIEAPFHVDSYCFPKTASAYDAVRCVIEFAPDLDAPSLTAVHVLVFDSSTPTVATEVRVPPLQMNPGFLASIKDKATRALRHVTTRVTGRDGSVSFEDSQRNAGKQ